VHAARALHTALGGIDGLTTAEVSVGRAELGYAGEADDDAIEQTIRFTIECAGLSLRSIEIEPDRRLPLF
jgi:hypothetical protein